MLQLIGKRLAFAIPSLIGVVIVTFLLTRALPGDPAAYFAGPAATTQAICDFRHAAGTDGPLFLAKDTHALSEPAWATALEVLAANGVRVLVDSRDAYMSRVTS